MGFLRQWCGVLTLFSIWSLIQGQELVEPDVLVLSSNITVLEVKKCIWNIEDKISLQTRCYCYQWEGKEKCSIPGPTLLFTNGSSGFVRLKNGLIGAGMFENGGDELLDDLISHDPDVINLHTHGLHVDPAVDDVIDLFVLPNDGNFQDYNFTILPDHYPGLHWYHDHWHGTVSFHTHTGLFGAIRVEREMNRGLDPRLVEMPSKTIIVHGLSLNYNRLNSNGTCKCANYSDFFDNPGRSTANNPLKVFPFHLTTICDQWCDMYCYQRDQSDTPPIQKFKNLDWIKELGVYSNINWDGGITLFMVNGAVGPVVTIQQSEWVRLRLLNADAQGSYILQFNETTDCEYYYIAADGIFFDTARDLSVHPYNYKLLFTMSGRVEVIMKCDVSGNYSVWQVPQHVNASVFCAPPVYNGTGLLFTIYVEPNITHFMSNTSDYDPTTLTFPPKTGYIQDTLGKGIKPKTSPECAQYNNTRIPGLTWYVDPDPFINPGCTTVTKTIVQDGKTITVDFSGELYGINGMYFEHGHQLASLLPDEVYEMNVSFFPTSIPSAYQSISNYQESR